jgi:hypothetical protein
VLAKNKTKKFARSTTKAHLRFKSVNPEATTTISNRIDAKKITFNMQDAIFKTAEASVAQPKNGTLSRPTVKTYNLGANIKFSQIRNVEFETSEGIWTAQLRTDVKGIGNKKEWVYLMPNERVSFTGQKLQGRSMDIVSDFTTDGLLGELANNEDNPNKRKKYTFDEVVNHAHKINSGFDFRK